MFGAIRKRRTQIGRMVLPLVTLALLAMQLNGCGSQSHISAIINGQELSLPVDGVHISAGGIGGIVPPGSAGFPLAGISLQISIRFINGNVVDELRFDILDAYAILPGQQVLIDGVNIIAIMTLNGVIQMVPPGSIIVFDELTLADGGDVRGSFQVFTAVALLAGSFDEEVDLAF